MHFDILIIGSGAAGLLTALELNSALKIAILSKNGLSDGCTSKAQGGISAVLHTDDSFESHIRDTETAGDGLCQHKTVRFVVEQAPAAIENMANLGLNFTRKQNAYHLTKEGGHNYRRVAHVADATGDALSNTLIKKVKQSPNIYFFSHHSAIDLITEKNFCDSNFDTKSEQVFGAYVLNIQNNVVQVFRATQTILATGGASKVYLYSSNPDGSTGDGIAMAWRAGCAVTNMEFNQFHPTCLFHPHAKSFLISEAVRGEGGKLSLPDGSSFMQNHDARKELAPRDIVARAIDHEMKRLGIDCVFLDLSFKSDEFIHSHFPLISQAVKNYGFDMSTSRLPVVPAAHYTCGGIAVDLFGKTSLRGLYAVGEVAHTGLHGANRLASNSLLECLVFARSVAQSINNTSRREVYTDICEWDESRVADSDEMVVVAHNWDELRRLMWNYVGIVRTNKRLERAKHRVRLLQREIDEYYGNFKVHSHLLELRNLVQVAEIMIDSALLRDESRGLHYNLDYPDKNSIATDTVLQKNDAKLTNSKK